MRIPSKLITDAKNKLNSDAAKIIYKDLKLKEFDEVNLKSLCPFHEEDTPSFVWNTEESYFHCFGCGINYGIIDHYMLFYKLTFLDATKKLFKETETKYHFGEQGVKTRRDYIYPKYIKNDSREKVENYLALRKISKETLEYCDVQQDNNENIVFNFYDDNDVLTLVKYRPARKVLPKEDKSWCQKGASSRPILFNMNRVDTTKTLLITEGEIDCLSAIESGYTNSVSVPLGSANLRWIEENFEWLEQFNKIIVWSDNDDPGIKMRKDVCSRLGEWRTLFVDLPKFLKDKSGKDIRVKDINEVLYFFGKERVSNFIENAEEFPISGVVNLARVEDFDLEAAPGIYTGINELDNMVYKFLLGNVLLVSGRTTSGKSTLINQLFICEPLNQGHDIFLYSSELSEQLIRSWIELTMAGLENVKMKENSDIHIIDKQAREQLQDWYDGRVWKYDEKSNKSDDILNKAVAITRRYGAKIWILDNLMTMDIDADSQSLYQKQKELIVKINGLAQLYGVFVVLVAHARKSQPGTILSNEEIKGAGDLANMAQYTMAVKRFSKEEKAGVKKYNGQGWKTPPIEHDTEVSIMKNRLTGKMGSIRLYFDYTSYRFYSRPSELWKRYKWNKSTAPLPTNDPNKHSEIPQEME